MEEQKSNCIQHTNIKCGNYEAITARKKNGQYGYAWLAILPKNLCDYDVGCPLKEVKDEVYNKKPE